MFQLGVLGELSEDGKEGVEQLALSTSTIRTAVEAFTEWLTVETAPLHPVLSDPLNVVGKPIQSLRAEGIVIDTQFAEFLPDVCADAEAVTTVVHGLVLRLSRVRQAVSVFIRVDSMDERVIVSIGTSSDISPNAPRITFPDEFIRDELSFLFLICTRRIELQGGKLWASQQADGDVALHFSLPATNC